MLLKIKYLDINRKSTEWIKAEHKPKQLVKGKISNITLFLLSQFVLLL